MSKQVRLSDEEARLVAVCRAFDVDIAALAVKLVTDQTNKDQDQPQHTIQIDPALIEKTQTEPFYTDTDTIAEKPKTAAPPKPRPKKKTTAADLKKINAALIKK